MMNSSNQNPSLISAEAILKSKSGRALSDKDVKITRQNVSDFEPTEETIDEVTQYFKKIGFSVLKSGLTLTIIGPPLLFEHTFNAKLILKKDNKTDSFSIHLSNKPTIPNKLSNVVEKIVFPRSPTLSDY